MHSLIEESRVQY